MKPEIHLDSFLKTPYGVFYSILLAGTLVYMTNKGFYLKIGVFELQTFSKKDTVK